MLNKTIRGLLYALLFLAGAAITQAAETKVETAAVKNPLVLIQTNLGAIKVELFSREAPLSVKNFLDYAAAGFYEGTIFHRVIPKFMIQGGGFTPDLKQKKGSAPIKNEADNGLKNLRGTIAMARTMMVDSATAQFFINVVDNGYLDHRDTTTKGYGYAVFGKVVEGMDVVDRIATVRTGIRNRIPDVPLAPVIIESAKVVE
ncbi:MAG: peptidylprolyl isomerase [Syntrophales bacterium]